MHLVHLVHLVHLEHLEHLELSTLTIKARARCSSQFFHAPELMEPQLHPGTLFGAVRSVLKLTVSVSIGSTDGRVNVAVPGVGRCPAASSRKEDVVTALNLLLGSDLVAQLELTGCGDGDVLQRYHREGRFQPTRRLKHRTLYLAEPQRCFYCQRALPRKGSAAQRCYTPRDFSPRLCACGDGRDDCPQTFKVGDAIFTKDPHRHRLVVTLASGLVVDAVPIG